MKNLHELNIFQLDFLNDNLNLNVAALKASTKVLDLRRWSYIISYPHFVNYFNQRAKITKDDLIVGGSFAYGWMPTTIVWKKDNFAEVVELLNVAKKGLTLLKGEDLSIVKSLVNGSIVGSSKLLHFINPEDYPIWDSKIHALIKNPEKRSSTNDVTVYLEYLQVFNALKKHKVSKAIARSVSEKIGIEISFARAFEMILFFTSQETFEKSKKINEPILKVPKYKRDEFIFISNLNKYTADDIYPITYKRDGYLLSEHYMTSTSIKLADKVKKRKNLLISDNGNFSRIKKIAAKHNDKGLDILNTARKELIDHGQLSQATIERRTKLMQLIAQECQTEVESLDISKITSKQLSIAPDYMIGMEDYAIPAMMLCNLMHPAFSPAAIEVKEYQERTLSLYARQEMGEFGQEAAIKKTTNFLVLHAYDYESALQAARQSTLESSKGIAISYGGPMLSNRWISSLEIGGQLEVFDEKLPESYLIAQSLTLGVVNGNTTNVPYHILGVGTPILIALIGYQLRHSRAISIDSTAPFKDAFAGTLYGDKAAYMKMNMYRVAASHLINGTEFKSSTPYFKAFENKYPSDWDGLREKMKITSDMNYKHLAEDLKENLPLVEKYIPFFSKMRGGKDEMIDLLRVCRSGHNFWILKRICNNVIKYRRDPVAFKKWIEKQIDRYTNAASYKWAKAVRKTYELTERHRNI